jgi:hypothetical protein
MLNLLLLLLFEHLDGDAWRLAGIAFALQVLAVLFSLITGSEHQDWWWPLLFFLLSIGSL